MYLKDRASTLEESLDEGLQLDIRITYAFDQSEEGSLVLELESITEITSSAICFESQTSY